MIVRHLKIRGLPKPWAFCVYMRKRGVIRYENGLDISTLALKKQVDQIILIAGDSDFVPASKLARREGIDFILDPLWTHIKDDLWEHIDGLRSKVSNPKSSELCEIK